MPLSFPVGAHSSEKDVNSHDPHNTMLLQKDKNLFLNHLYPIKSEKIAKESNKFMG